MANTHQKYMDVDVIAFLEEVMKGNTKHYQSDFDYDKEFIARAAKSDRKEDKTLLWLSRIYGTWSCKEHDAFVQDTFGYNTWLYYADAKSQSILTYSVELTGIQEGVIRGNVYELDFQKLISDIQSKAVAPSVVEKTFEDGFVERIPLDRSSYGHYYKLVDAHGPIVDSLSIPKDENAHRRILAEQKAMRDKLKEAPSRAMLPIAVSELTAQLVENDPHLYTCQADKGYSFLVRATNEAAAELIGKAWYENAVVEPGHFSCRKTRPEDLKDINYSEVIESKAYSYLRQANSMKPPLSQQIQSAADRNTKNHISSDKSALVR